MHAVSDCRTCIFVSLTVVCDILVTSLLSGERGIIAWGKPYAACVPYAQGENSGVPFKQTRMSRVQTSPETVSAMQQTAQPIIKTRHKMVTQRVVQPNEPITDQDRIGATGQQP